MPRPCESPTELTALVAAAWDRRAPLHDSDVDAYRVVNRAGDGLDGLVVDRYGDLALIVHESGEALERIAALVDALDQRRRFEVVVARPRGGGRPRVLRGVARKQRLMVHEAGLRFWIEPWRRGNPGLYLDGRPARHWIRDHSAGRALLNLFAFGGSAGVAAAVGGARAVTHVDLAADALELCRANHELNQVPVDDRALVRVNLYQHLRRAAAARRRFDAIVLDPPPLTAHARRSDRTPGERGHAGLVPLVGPMLAADGWLLCFFHARGQTREALEEQVLADAGVPLEVLWRGDSGDDFPERDPLDRLRVTAFRRR